eukprot:6266980-Ditylum_brightwellii.AAC.1
MSCKTRDSTLVHKFVHKYSFKGSWDATRKLFHQAINCLELKHNRITNANDCYEKLGRKLSKDGAEKSTLKLEQYEQDGSYKVSDDTTLQTRCTFVGLGTEDKAEYD